MCEIPEGVRNHVVMLISIKNQLYVFQIIGARLRTATHATGQVGNELSAISWIEAIHIHMIATILCFMKHGANITKMINIDLFEVMQRRVLLLFRE